MLRRYEVPALAIALTGVVRATSATESIEFVAEHLPEIAMDNRYASLPLWNSCGKDAQVCFGLNAGYARTHSGTLSINGPMVSLNVTRALNDRFRLTGFVFFDELVLSSGVDRRPLEVGFADPPIALPAEAQFSGLNGRGRDIGFGVALNGIAHWSWLPWFEWSAGLLWQQFKLTDYQFDYSITDGPDEGMAGTLDYSASYNYVAPFFGAAWPRLRGDRWRYAPHVQFAVPLPAAAIQGRITGPSFDISGETGAIGDTSVTIGFDITYLPWNFTVDLGSTVTQAVLEPKIHEGVNQNLMLAVYWTF
jgi:hypothetical protein